MKLKRLFILGLLSLFIVLGFFNFNDNKENIVETNEIVLNTDHVSYLNSSSVKDINSMFLSDLSLEPESKAGWRGDITVDKNLDGNNITLNIDGGVKTMLKGVVAHASATLVYDISAYTDEFTRFISYAGLNSDKPEGNINMYIYTSKTNKEEFNEVFRYEGLTSTKTQRIDLDVTGVKYIKFYFDKNGVDTQDHSLLGNPKLVKPEYKEVKFDDLLSIEEYDNHFNSISVGDAINERDSIYKREFMYRYGNKSDLEILADGSPSMLNTLNWLLHDDTALRLLVEVGELARGVAPERLYSTVLIYLSELYNHFKEDLTNDQDGMNYKRMMIALAMAMGGDRLVSVLGFRTFIPNFDIIKRFENYKYLYQNKFLRKDLFNNYNMELMRLIMNTGISNEEMLWLQGYSEIRYKDEQDRIRYYNFLDYQSPNYHQPQYWAIENKEKWDEKYHLTEFNIEYGKPDTTKYWMAVETGGICWNQSRFGGDLMKLHGIPSVGSFQPGHETVLEYVFKDGIGKWDHGYNIGGWGVSYGIWFWADYFRTMYNWNIREFARINGNEEKKHSTNYLLVAQDFMNQDNYLDSMLYNYLAKGAKNSTRKLEIYNKALEINSLNIDAWDGIIKIYQAEGRKSSEFKTLLDRIINTFMYHPAVYDDYISIIKPSLSGSDSVYIDSRRLEALNHALTLTDKISLDGNACKDVANALLNKNKEPIVTFSFDGDNANTILVNQKYEGQGLRFSYSLDGGSTYIDTTETKILLTDDEVKKISPEFGIFFKIDGIEAPFVIEINEGSAIGSEISVNDFENTLYGDTSNVLYSYDDIDYLELKKNTRFEGDVDVYIKYKAHKTTMEGSSKKVTFTQDNYLDRYSYIYTENVEFISATGNHQGGDSPKNLFDGNLNTRYHTQHRVVTKEKVIVIKLNEIKNLGMISYVSDGFNGKIKDMNIYVSTKENIDSDYILVKEVRGLERNHSNKAIIFDSPVEALYVKLEAINTYGNYDSEINMYLSGQEISFFECMNISDSKIDGLVDELDFTGNEVRQNLTLTYKNEVLKEGVDYTITYTNNLNPGKATIKISGIGRFIGEVKLSFNIKEEILPPAPKPDDGDDMPLPTPDNRPTEAPTEGTVPGGSSDLNSNDTTMIVLFGVLGGIFVIGLGIVIFIIFKTRKPNDNKNDQE